MSIEDRIKEIVAEQLGVEVSAVTADSTFASLGADSLDQVELVMALEDEFKIEISDAEAETVNSIEKAIELVSKRVNN